jgi:4-amino-4-deoxy-L-arabinose transferase-like glycosyltransferase
MAVSFNALTAARYPRPRSAGRTPTRPAVLAPRAASARATVTLALGVYGLVDLVEDLGAPWAWLVQTLVLTLVAVGCFVAAQRANDHRLGWMLSGSVAAGLALTAFSNLIDATPALPLAGVLVCIATALFAARGARQRHTAERP